VQINVNSAITGQRQTPARLGRARERREVDGRRKGKGKHKGKKIKTKGTKGMEGKRKVGKRMRG